MGGSILPTEIMYSTFLISVIMSQVGEVLSFSSVCGLEHTLQDGDRISEVHVIHVAVISSTESMAILFILSVNSMDE